MKKFYSIMLITTLLAICAAPVAFAATANPSPNSPGYMTLPFQISQQYTATTAGVVRFKMPFPVKVLNVYASARASGGTTPTLTVDVKEAGTTILSTPISITAGTVSEGTLTDTKIADEAVVTVDLNIGGTSPTWNDITVVLVCKRL